MDRHKLDIRRVSLQEFSELLIDSVKNLTTEQRAQMAAELVAFSLGKPATDRVQ